MKTRTFIFTFFACLLSVLTFSQSAMTNISSQDMSADVGIPFIRNDFSNSSNVNGELLLKSTYSQGINSIGVGWESVGSNVPSDYHIDYRFKDSNGVWMNWKHTHGEITPAESPSNKFWSSLIITDYMIPSTEIEVKLFPPNGSAISTVRLDASYIGDTKGSNVGVRSNRSSSSCPSQPFIFQRSDWWGSLPADELYYPNGTNSKTPSYNSNTTHAFIHHGASTNSYTDGAAVVRSYWNFHVNSRGWKDIGYTYLVDKFGNLYMGRYNPDWPNRDILGAHTGVANPNSFAICAIGDYATTSLSSSALQSIENLLAYKCDLRTMNPVGTGFIHSITIDIISGHRDAPQANTTCPGSAAHADLQLIRNRVKSHLDSCALGPVPVDNIAPVTSINSPHLWERSDFTMPISDVDDSAGTGIKEKLVSVSYFDNDWKANVSNGYFNDQFTQLSPAWTPVIGNWFVQSSTSELIQNDENEANTNLYASLNQNNSNVFLYHWNASISGVGSNKRAGLHFMCSAPNQSERGDSYMVYFREDNDKIQIYKSVGNTLYLREDTSYTINQGVVYDCKVLYNKSIGEIKVYVNNQLAAIYSDPWPLLSGNFVSVRTGNCIYSIDKLEVFKERQNSVTVTVGQGSKDIPVENTSPSIAAGLIKSIALDSASNLSLIQSRFVNVDWSKPSPVYVNDEYVQGVDVDTILRDDRISGNWLVNDVNSGIKKYSFGVGNAPGLTNIIPFTDIGAISQYTVNTTLNFGTTYYITIKAFNGAGLDTIITSDGQYLKEESNPASIQENNIFKEILLYPNPASNEVFAKFYSPIEGNGNIDLIDASGKLVLSHQVYIKDGENNHQIELFDKNLSAGFYFVKLNIDSHSLLLGIQGVK